MSRHLLLPIRQACPRPHLPHLFRRTQHGCRIGDRTAPHCTPMQNRRVTKKPHVEKSTQSQLRTPKPPMQLPTGFGQRLRRPPPPHLHHRDAIPLLRQPVRAHTPAKSRANDDEIKIKHFVIPSEERNPYTFSAEALFSVSLCALCCILLRLL